MVQKAASGKMEKPQKPERVGRFFYKIKWLGMDRGKDKDSYTL